MVPLAVEMREILHAHARQRPFHNYDSIAILVSMLRLISSRFTDCGGAVVWVHFAVLQISSDPNFRSDLRSFQVIVIEEALIF